MTDDLANIFGTEKDRINCPFYFRIGACRHGDTCTRLHHKPSISQTILLQHMYHHPYQGLSPEQVTKIDQGAVQQDFDEFYEDVFTELSKYGEIEDMMACDNLSPHMIGNLYVKYVDDTSAQRAFMSVNGRLYEGRPIQAEYSPVTDFREAQCRQFDLGECTRGAFCNFVHMKKPTRELQRKLFAAQRETYHKSRDRSRSRSRRRSRSRHHHHHHGHGHGHHHRHHHHRHHDSSDSDDGDSDDGSRSRSRSRSRHSRRHYSRSRSGDRHKYNSGESKDDKIREKSDRKSRSRSKSESRSESPIKNKGENNNNNGNDSSSLVKKDGDHQSQTEVSK